MITRSATYSLPSCSRRDAGPSRSFANCLGNYESPLKTTAFGVAFLHPLVGALCSLADYLDLLANRTKRLDRARERFFAGGEQFQQAHFLDIPGS